MSRNDTSSISETEAPLITSSGAAQRLAMTAAAVRKAAERGDLPIAQKLPGRMGAYLFRESDVEALAAKRRADLQAQLDRLNGAAS